MIPYFEQPTRELIGQFTLLGKELGPFAIHGWGVMVCLGIILGTQVAAKRAETVGHDPDVVHDFAVWAVLSGFIGAHVVEVLFYTPDEFRKDPWILVKFWSGFSSFGGYLGAAVGILLFRRARGIRFLDYSDSIALGFAFAWIFGRTGCFLAHDHIGKYSDFFLAVDFPGGARHDLGLYEAILSAGLTAILYAVRDVPGRGFSTGVLLTLYAPARFGLDFLRSTDKLYLGAFTPAHFLSVPLFLVGVALIVRARREAMARAPGAGPAGSAEPAEPDAADAGAA